MSTSIVLLNDGGEVVLKLPLISLPKNYIIPKGMTVCWTEVIFTSSPDTSAMWSTPTEPEVGFFFLGDSQGYIQRNGFTEYGLDSHGRLRFGFQKLTVGMQGPSAREVVELHRHMTRLIHSCASWDVTNDLNPSMTKRVLRLFRRSVGMAEISKK